MVQGLDPQRRGHAKRCSPTLRPLTRTSVIGRFTASRRMYAPGMFDDASAFDQDLGWCVDDDVDLGCLRSWHLVRVDVLWRVVGWL